MPANLALTPFGALAPSQFGSAGDLRLVPDAATRSRMPPSAGYPAVEVMLGDLREPDGTAWECCPRQFLRSALLDLESETGLTVRAAFEHEFTELAAGDREHPFGLQALLTGAPLGMTVVRALDDAGLQPETWLPEFGARQWEITVAPAAGMVAADRAVLLREIVRAAARRLDRKVTFTPVPEWGGATSGVHVHLSLWHTDGTPATHDAQRPGGLSDRAGWFAAGILRHAGAVLALTAPSAVSYQRLRPGNWSAGRATLRHRDREALLRVPATVDWGGQDPGPQLNIEFRGADATSNPWLALGAIVRAGLEGLRAELAPPLTDDGLPSCLQEALRALESDPAAMAWFPSALLRTYLAVKREELRTVSELSDAERCARYADVY